MSTSRNWMVLLKLWSPGDTNGDSKISFDLLDGDIIQLAVNPANEFPKAAMATPLRGRWFCVELGVGLSGPRGEGQAWLYIDGNLILSSSEGIATIKTRGIDRLSFGLDVSGADRASEVLVDDVVVATKRIGCE
ncbi:MAG: hypothetical protein SF187_09350 [Deltaproteobacteria bacterium]|nr:hypothetical protein [Deltaproteobacteria bacterium]